jgi:hypothetical protein
MTVGVWWRRVRTGRDRGEKPPTAAGFAAFISYRHAEPDKTIAEHLHRALEGYRPPLQGGRQAPWRVFLDTAEGQAGGLGEQIRSGLRAARHLIVVCSPRVRQSPWVEEEVEEFLRHHPVDRVLPLLTEGEPETAFPRNLLARCRTTFRGPDGTESAVVDRLGADVRARDLKGALARLKTEKLRLLAPLLGVTYDQLFARERRRRRQRRRRFAGAAAALLLAALAGYGLSLTDWYQVHALLAQRAPLDQIDPEVRVHWFEALVRTGHPRAALRSLNDLKDERAVDPVLIALVRRGLAEQAVAARHAMAWYHPAPFTDAELARELTAAGRSDLALQVIAQFCDPDASKAGKADVRYKRQIRLKLLIDVAQAGPAAVSALALQGARKVAAKIAEEPSLHPGEDVSILLRLAGELWRQGRKGDAKTQIDVALKLARRESPWGYFQSEEPQATFEALVDLDFFDPITITGKAAPSERRQLLALFAPALLRHGQPQAVASGWGVLLTEDSDPLPLIQVLVERGQPRVAELLLRELKPETTLSAHSLETLCAQLAQDGAAGLAIACYRTAAARVDTTAGDASSKLSTLATASIALGDSAGALSAWRTRKEKAPIGFFDAETRAKISSALADSGQWREAEAVLTGGYVDLLESHSDAFWSALGRLMDHDFASGNAQATLDLARAFKAQSDEEYTEILGFVAEKLALAGQHERAQEAYREAALLPLDRPPGYSVSRPVFLAWRLSAVGLFTEAQLAAVTVEKSLEANPASEPSWLPVAGALAAADDEGGAEKAFLRSAAESHTLADWHKELQRSALGTPSYLAAALGAKLPPFYPLVAVDGALARAHRRVAFAAALTQAKRSAEWPELAYGIARLLSARPEDVPLVRPPAPGTAAAWLFASTRADILFHAGRWEQALAAARIVPCGDRSPLLLDWTRDLERAGRVAERAATAGAWGQALLEGPRGICRQDALRKVLDDVWEMQGLLDRELLRAILLRCRDRILPHEEEGDRAQDLFALAWMMARSGFVRDARQTVARSAPELRLKIDTLALYAYSGVPPPDSL